MNQRLNTELTLYDLENADTELIRNYDNQVYQFKAGKTYALRVCTPGVYQARLKNEVLNNTF